MAKKKPINMPFATVCRYVRSQRGKTQSELAFELGTTQAYWHMIETGKQLPSPSMAAEIIRKLELHKVIGKLVNRRVTLKEVYVAFLMEYGAKWWDEPLT